MRRSLGPDLSPFLPRRRAVGGALWIDRLEHLSEVTDAVCYVREGAGWYATDLDGEIVGTGETVEQTVIASGRCSFRWGTGLRIHTGGLLTPQDVLPWLDAWVHTLAPREPWPGIPDSAPWYSFEWEDLYLRDERIDPDRMVRIDDLFCVAYRHPDGRPFPLLLEATGMPVFLHEWARVQISRGDAPTVHVIGEVAPGVIVHAMDQGGPHDDEPWFTFFPAGVGATRWPTFDAVMGFLRSLVPAPPSVADRDPELQVSDSGGVHLQLGPGTVGWSRPFELSGSVSPEVVADREVVSREASTQSAAARGVIRVRRIVAADGLDREWRIEVLPGQSAVELVAASGALDFVAGAAVVIDGQGLLGPLEVVERVSEWCGLPGAADARAGLSAERAHRLGVSQLRHFLLRAGVELMADRVVRVDDTLIGFLELDGQRMAVPFGSDLRPSFVDRWLSAELDDDHHVASYQLGLVGNGMLVDWLRSEVSGPSLRLLASLTDEDWNVALRNIVGLLGEVEGRHAGGRFRVRPNADCEPHAILAGILEELADRIVIPEEVQVSEDWKIEDAF